MVWTRYQFIVGTTAVISCSACIICIKWSSKQKVKGWDGKERKFNHPFVLTAIIYVADLLCLLLFRVMYIYLKRRKDGSEERNKFTRGNHEFNPLSLAIPASTELIGSCLQLMGLNLTHAASFQMIKTSVILFTAILRICFLKKKLKCREWVGIFIVIGALIAVTLADSATPKERTDKSEKNDSFDIIIADVLIFLSQIFTAVYLVTEEYFLSGKDLQPLEVLGWEGIWGLTVMLVLLIILYFVPCPQPYALNSRQTMEDALDAFVQVYNSSNLQIFMFLFVFTLMVCKIMGVNLTKEFSSVLRRVLDSLRVIILYVFSLIVFGQKFHYLHLLGFLILIFGVLLHNNAINMNTARWIGRKCHCVKTSEEEESGENIEEQAEKEAK